MATVCPYPLSLHDALPISVLGSVGASQLGAPWSVTGSQWVTGVVSVTQASSPWIVQVACTAGGGSTITGRSEEHTSELQSHHDLVCRLLLAKKNTRRTSFH